MPECMISGAYAVVHGEKNHNSYSADQFLCPRCSSRHFIHSDSLNLHTDYTIDGYYYYTHFVNEETESQMFSDWYPNSHG